MALSWWQLPGAARFIGEIIEALRSGRNVVLLLPDRLQSGLAGAVRSEYSDELQWVTFDSPKNQLPVDALFERFASDAPPHEIRNARNLAKADGFQGLLVWVTGIETADWPAWAEFIAEYEAVCRSVDQMDRTLLCLPIQGKATLHPIGSEVCLARIIWQNAVRHQDMQFYMSLSLDELGLHGVQRDLACRLASGLALWDPDAARELSRGGLPSLLEPSEVLRRIAGERGWVAIDHLDWESLWRVGAADRIEGQWNRHSALYAFRDKDRELDRRLWKAEVEVLLPWVETQRRMLLERYGAFLRVPFSTRDGRVIHDVLDLEIGHIERLLYEAPRRPPRNVMELVGCLKEIRNALAHLSPVRADLVMASLTGPAI